MKLGRKKKKLFHLHCVIFIESFQLSCMSWYFFCCVTVQLTDNLVVRGVRSASLNIPLKFPPVGLHSACDICERDTDNKDTDTDGSDDKHRTKKSMSPQTLLQRRRGSLTLQVWIKLIGFD